MSGTVNGPASSSGAAAAQARIDAGVKRSERAPQQPAHDTSTVGAHLSESLLPALVSLPVLLGVGRLSLRSILPHVHGAFGVGLALAVPLAATVATFAGVQYLTHKPPHVDAPAPLPTPRAVAASGSIEGDRSLSGTLVGSVRGFAGNGAVASTPLTLDGQVGRLGGYDAQIDAVNDAVGQGNVAVLKVGDRYQDYAVTKPSTAATMLDGDRPEITASDARLVAVVRGGLEAFTRAAGQGSTFAFDGEVTGADTAQVVPEHTIPATEVAAGRVVPAHVNSVDEGTSLAKLDELGKANTSELTSGDVRGAQSGFVDERDALGAALELDGDQAVVKHNDRFVVVDVHGAETGHDVRGVLVSNADVVALEWQGGIYAPSGPRFARANFATSVS